MSRGTASHGKGVGVGGGKGEIETGVRKGHRDEREMLLVGEMEKSNGIEGERIE